MPPPSGSGAWTKADAERCQNLHREDLKTVHGRVDSLKKEIDKVDERVTELRIESARQAVKVALIVGITSALASALCSTLLTYLVSKAGG